LERRLLFGVNGQPPIVGVDVPKTLTGSRQPSGALSGFLVSDLSAQHALFAGFLTASPLKPTHLITAHHPPQNQQSSNFHKVS
jgi:hypothetical protein